MFSSMIQELKTGRMPDSNLLRKRFEAGLIKKMGVIKTPYPFWPADSKINPPVKQLFWAAILLEDRESFHMVEAIIASELEEKQRAKGLSAGNQFIHEQVQQLLKEYAIEFVELAPNEKFKSKLQLLSGQMVSFQSGSRR